MCFRGRPHISLVRKKKKWPRKRKIGQQVYSLFHQRGSRLRSLTTGGSWFRVNISNMYSGLKRLLHFVATHEVVFAVLTMFGCLNFARNVVFHRHYLKGAFQRIKQ